MRNLNWCKQYLQVKKKQKTASVIEIATCNIHISVMTTCGRSTDHLHNLPQLIFLPQTSCKGADDLSDTHT